MLDVDGDKEISIVDLIWLCSKFSEETRLGTDLANIFEIYMEKNVRPKYVKNKYLIDFGMFVSLLPHCTLIEDMQNSFGEKIDESLGNEYQSCKPLLGSNAARTFEHLVKRVDDSDDN